MVELSQSSLDELSQVLRTDLNNHTYKYITTTYGHRTNVEQLGLLDMTFSQTYNMMKLAYLLNVKYIFPECRSNPLHTYGNIFPIKFTDYFSNPSYVKYKDVLREVEVIDSTGTCASDTDTRFLDDKICPYTGIDPSDVLVVRNLAWDIVAQTDALSIETVSKLTKKLLENQTPGVDTITPRCQQAIELATNIFNEIQPRTSIHIRRGDKTWSVSWINSRTGKSIPVQGEQWSQATNAENVIDLLEHQNVPGPVYVMTDMKPDDEQYIKLKNCGKYKFYFLDDFPQLTELRQLNNHKAFNVEMHISENTEYGFDRFAVARWGLTKMGLLDDPMIPGRANNHLSKYYFTSP